MTKKLSEKLFDRLIEIGLEPVTIPQRIMAGYWQRSAGAWRWSCRDKYNCEIGGQESMLDLIKADKLSYYKQGLDTHVCPE